MQLLLIVRTNQLDVQHHPKAYKVQWSPVRFKVLYFFVSSCILILMVFDLTFRKAFSSKNFCDALINGNIEGRVFCFNFQSELEF